MPITDGFVLFCDDYRSEVANKQSIMGFYGPQLHLIDPPEGAPLQLGNLSIICIVRSEGVDELKVDFEIEFENAPIDTMDNVTGNTVISDLPTDRQWSSNFHVKMGGLPIQAGMTIKAKFNVNGQAFAASLGITDAPMPQPLVVSG
ncbi:hypothetical protein MRBLMA1_001198 [Sphingobium sp. LMA1-1-1.1]|uniref:hypothetical protein n=1 Tax=Sphingobium sp. LMA1-1-1.1 TaxID=3135238 RepID=UPI00343E247D